MAEPQVDAGQSARRQSLIDATMSAIAEHGFSNLTLSKISRLAGLTAGTVNFHFDSKEALLLETLQQVADEFEQHIAAALERASEDPVAQLDALIQASLDPVLTEPRRVAVWYAFMSEASAREDYQRICGSRDKRYGDTILGLCSAIIDAAGQQAGKNAPAIARALSGLIDELWQDVLFNNGDYDRSAARDQARAFLASVFPWSFEMPAAPDVRAEAVPTESNGLIYTLPAWAYRSEAFFALEMEHIFMPSWHIVCHQSDLPAPGSYATFDMLNERAVVVRDQANQVRAFHNVCRHRAHSLVTKDLGRCPGRLTCPYHGWTYALDGQRIAIGAAESFRPHEAAEFGLTSLDCEVYNGFVFIRFRTGGPSVAELFAPVADEFAAYRTAEMSWCGNDDELDFWMEEIEVDWKNGTENYLEDYHFATGHKGLAALMDPAYDRDPHPGMGRLSHAMRDKPRGNWSAERYREVLPQYAHLPEAARTRWTYYALFPTTFFDLYPEQMDFMQMLPVAPGRMLLRGRCYSLTDESREGRAARYLSNRINSRVQNEDNLLTSEVQRGLRTSAYEYGILSDKEILVHHFQNWVREKLPAATLRREPAEALAS